MDKVRILVVGCGNMGASHAMAYHKNPGFEICGLVSRGQSKETLNDELGGNLPLYSDFDDALARSAPDAVCISTYPDTHEQYAVKALTAGCHVFIEKPLAETVEGARHVADVAMRAHKKLVVGYILQHHPMWQRFITTARELGKPLVMRMNLNQQSHGHTWHTHLNLLKSLSPIVDCGVHYLDVMCQMTRSKPVWVNAIGARLSDEVPGDNYNYGQLQIQFADGSVGWYEAGWGPMISETAFFIKDVIGPKGSVSIVPEKGKERGKSDHVDGHTATENLLVHSSELDENGGFRNNDQYIGFEEQIGHQELCDREQDFFLKAINDDADLTNHVRDAVTSLQIALACDASIREQKVIHL